MASVAGVLWYLHNEVVTVCPRKNAITRILRVKVTLQRFVPFVAMDSGRSTVPGASLDRISFPGCQSGKYAGWEANWYSLPGRCPLLDMWSKYDGCEYSQPGGGFCGCDRKLGEPGCNYHYEHAGEIDVNELIGFGSAGDYQEFCANGGLEYDTGSDTGIHLDWWDGFLDHEKAASRVGQVLQAFEAKYPNTTTTLGESQC